MIIKAAFSRSDEPGVLASARLELASYTGELVIIDECQVVRNKKGRLSLALPTFVFFSDRSFIFRNLPTRTRRDIEAVVLHEFEAWLREAR